VVNVATEASESLRQEMEEERWMSSHRDILTMLADMDTDGSSELTKDELFKGFHTNDEFRKLLEDYEIVEEDLEIVWAHLDPDHSGGVTPNEFAHQLCSMKSSNTQFMILYIKYYISTLKILMVGELQKLKVDVKETLEEDMEKLERDVEGDVNDIQRSVSQFFSESRALGVDVRGTTEKLASERRPLTLEAERHPASSGSDSTVDDSRQIMSTVADIDILEIASHLQSLLKQSLDSVNDLHSVSKGTPQRNGTESAARPPPIRYRPSPKGIVQSIPKHTGDLQPMQKESDTAYAHSLPIERTDESYEASRNRYVTVDDRRVVII